MTTGDISIWPHQRIHDVQEALLLVRQHAEGGDPQVHRRRRDQHPRPWPARHRLQPLPGARYRETEHGQRQHGRQLVGAVAEVEAGWLDAIQGAVAAAGDVVHHKVPQRRLHWPCALMCMQGSLSSMLSLFSSLCR